MSDGKKVQGRDLTSRHTAVWIRVMRADHQRNWVLRGEGRMGREKGREKKGKIGTYLRRPGPILGFRPANISRTRAGQCGKTSTLTKRGGHEGLKARRTRMFAETYELQSKKKCSPRAWSKRRRNPET